jgi:hypothetical protein
MRDNLKLGLIVGICVATALIAMQKIHSHQEKMEEIKLSMIQSEELRAFYALEAIEENKPWYSKLFGSNENKRYEKGMRRNHK